MLGTIREKVSDLIVDAAYVLGLPARDGASANPTIPTSAQERLQDVLAGRPQVGPRLVTVTGLPQDTTAGFVPQIDQALQNLQDNLSATGADVKSIGRIVMLIDDSAMDEYRAIYKTRGSVLGSVWKQHLGKHFAAMAAIGVPSLENGAKVKFVVEAVGNLQGRDVGKTLQFYVPGKGYYDAASVGDTILSGGAVGWNNATQIFERLELFGQMDVALANVIGAVNAAGGDVSQIDQLTAFVVGDDLSVHLSTLFGHDNSSFNQVWSRHFRSRPRHLEYYNWSGDVENRFHDLRNGASVSRFLSAHLLGYQPVTLNLVQVSSLVEKEAKVEVLTRFSKAPNSAHASRVANRIHLAKTRAVERFSGFTVFIR